MADSDEKAKGLFQLSAKWGDGRDLEQVFCDEMLVQVLKDRAYVTFGQIRMPIGADAIAGEGQVRPLVRLILPKESVKRMVEAFNRVLKTDSENPEE